MLSQQRTSRFDLAIFEDASDPMLWVSSDGLVLHRNKAATQLGDSAEEGPVFVWDLDPGISPDRFSRHWRLLNRRGRLSYLTQVRHRQAAHKQFRVRASLTNYGEIHAGLVVIREEAARVPRPARIKDKWLDLVPAPTLTVRESEVRLNRAAVDLLGYPAEGFRTARQLFRELFDDESALVWKLWQDDANAAYLHGRTLSVRKRDGKTCMMRFQVTRDARREVWVLQDVSREDELEKALQSAESRFQLTTQAARDVLFDWDLKTDVLQWITPREVFGYAVRSTDVLWWNDKIHPADRNAVNSSLSQAFAAHQQSWAADYRFRRADGEYADVETRALMEANHVIGAMTDVTVSRELERLLKAEAQRWELAVQASNAGIWELNLSTGKRYFSPMWKQILEVASDDIENPEEQWRKRIHPNDSHRVLTEFQHCLSGLRDTVDAEYRVLGKDGTWKWVWERARTQRNEANEPVRVIGSLLDMTSSKHLEQQLERSHAQYRALVEAIPDGICCYDRDHRYTYANEPVLQTLGRKLQDVLGKSDRELGLPAAEADVWEQYLDRAALDEGILEHNFDFSGTRGNRHYHSRAKVMRDANSLATIAVIRDMTGLIAVRRNLERYQEQLDHAQRLAKLGVCHYDIRTQKFHASDEVYRIFGFGFRHGMNALLRRIHPADRARVEQAFRGLVSSGGEFNLEFRILRKPGEYAYAHSYATLEYDARDQPEGVTGFIQDTTELTTNLQTMGELNRALTRTNTELNQFAYAVSHDLQEPLRNIITHTQMFQALYGESLDRNASAIQGEVERSATRMKGLIQDLLAYCRVLHLPNHAPGTQCSTDAALKWAIMNLSTAIQESEAVITYDALPSVPGDDSSFVQLFQNLLSNSLKYRSSAQPRIHVSVTDEGSHWRFCFRDNGIGIAPEYHETIFGLFKRLHGKEYPGTGIGLSLCHGIVQNSGGQIWVESAEGQGAAFFFTIPKTSIPR